MVGSFSNAVGDAARGGLCFVLRQYANAGNWLLRRITGQGDLLNHLGSSTAPYAQFYRWACDIEPPPNFDNSTAFGGGQCDEPYVVKFDATSYRSDGTVFNQYLDSQVIIWGRIESITWAHVKINATEARDRVYFKCHGLAIFPYDPEVRTLELFNSSLCTYDGTFEVTNIRVTRQDNQPDTCGDPPPQIDPPPGNWNHYDVDITYNDDNGVDVTVPVTFIFGFAFINARAEINIPFTLQVSPTLNFQGTLNVNTGDTHVDLFPTVTNNNGDTIFNFPGSNNNYDFNNNFDIELPRPLPPPGGNYNDNGPGDNNGRKRVIRGVIVTVYGINSSKHTVLYQTANPNIYVPNLGFVQFKVNVNGIEAWTTDKPVKSLRHFIECDWIGGAVDVRGTPQPGIQFELSPVYSLSEAGVEYPAPAP